jgi:hypothetical protein
MLKYLGIFALIFALAVFVARQDERAARESAQITANPDKGAISTKADEHHPQENIQQAERNTPSWYGFFRWPNGTTTWAIILTLLAITEQTKQTAKATKATQESVAHIERQAGIMEGQLRTVINSERPWIVVSVDSPVPGEFRFWATNEGRTPAKVISIWSCSLPLMRDDKLTIPPDEKTNESLVQSPPCLIPPTAKQIIWQCKVADFQKASGGGKGDQSLFSRGFFSAYIFGRIRYFDVLDAESTVPHETKWLYWLIPVKDAMPFPDPRHPEYNTYS